MLTDPRRKANLGQGMFNARWRQVGGGRATSTGQTQVTERRRNRPEGRFDPSERQMDAYSIGERQLRRLEPAEQSEGFRPRLVANQHINDVEDRIYADGDGPGLPERRHPDERG